MGNWTERLGRERPVSAERIYQLGAQSGLCHGARAAREGQRHGEAELRDLAGQVHLAFCRWALPAERAGAELFAECWCTGFLGGYFYGLAALRRPARKAGQGGVILPLSRR